VFVFAVTQVTALLAHELSWGGLGKSMLVLALVWWAWSAFVWATNAQEEESAVMRGALFLGMVLIFITGLALPHAFSDAATIFALSYAGVRLLHLALYADAARRGNASFSAIAGFGVTVLVGMALLIVGSLLEEPVRVPLWIAAAAIDYAGPAWLTREQLRGLQRVAVAHFAERYSLFIIICLGESIVATGVGAAGHAIDAELVLVVALALSITIGLWATYFGRLADAAEQRVRDHSDPVLAAADAYSYLHLILVAGIIVFAVGVKLAVAHPGQPLGDGARLAFCGGIAAYLAGLVAFRLRLLGSFAWDHVAAAVAVIAIFAVTGSVAASAMAAAVTAVIAVLATRELTSQA
jgi:low temperature requirement protein LtrA